MRIGINGMLLWGRFSGVERSIDELVTALGEVDATNEYVLYVGRDFSGRPPQRRNWSVHRAPVNAQNRTTRIAWEQGRLPKLARRDRLDVLHAPGYVLPLRCRVPMVLTIYDLFAITHSRLAKTSNALHYRFAIPRSVKRAHRIIVPSTFVKDQLVEVLGVGPDKVNVVHLGVSPAFEPIEDVDLQRAVKTRYRLPHSFLLFVGNLEPKKNLPRLLRAFKLVRESIPSDAWLVLAGRPAWGRDNLRQVADDLRIGHRVRLLDYVRDQDLPTLYSLAEAAALPSLCEGFGLPALEAMASGTPVIASNATAVPEVVGNAARLVDPLSEQSIAEGLIAVMTDEDLRKLLMSRGRDRAAMFTWARTARETLDVYHRAAGVHP